MANITERIGKDGKVSYRIRVFVGEKNDGTQILKSTTYKPEPDMKQKQIEKKLEKVARDFEEKIKAGLSAYDGLTKLSVYGAQWIANAQIAPKTRERYISLFKRIDDALGHLRLQNIQSRHLNQFYANLGESGVKNKGRYASAHGLGKLMEERNISGDELARQAGLSSSTVGIARRGERVSIKTAEKISAALNVPVKQIFTLNEATGGLADKTILHHHRLLSAILGQAKLEKIIQYNVAVEHTKAPKLNRKEARYLSDVEAKELVTLLIDEPDIRVRSCLLLALYSGVRRGELCGLSWQDIDFEKYIIQIRRASQYQSRVGVVEVGTKNKTSQRPIKLPPFIFDVLAQYKKWWTQQRLINGSKWQGELNRLFIQSDGKPINPDTVNFWLDKFIEKHGLTRFTPHSLRHTFSTLQIAAGVDIRTLQARTGHAQASTLMNIYAHEIQTANEMAADTLDNILTPSYHRVKAPKAE